MNLATLNDWLKRGLTAAQWSARDVEKVIHSPCLTLTDFNEPITEADAEAVSLIEDDGVIRTPFPMFRYWMQGNQNVLFGCGKRERGTLFLISFHKERSGIGPACWLADYLGGNPFGGRATYADARAFSTRDFQDVTKKYLLRKESSETGAKSFEISPGGVDLATLSDEKKRELCAKLRQDIREEESNLEALNGHVSALRSTIEFMDGVLLPNVGGLDGLIPSQPCPEYVWLALHGCVMRACYEYLAPYNFTAVVRPDKPGKSVEWIKAREHYTVIHRKHPANAIGFAGRVTPVAAATSRLAHSRRAHTRLLSSPRYAYKRGQRIPIRASWVGPAEWKDTAGQIYQILRPVDAPSVGAGTESDGAVGVSSNKSAKSAFEEQQGLQQQESDFKET